VLAIEIEVRSSLEKPQAILYFDVSVNLRLILERLGPNTKQSIE
jgi:hypothetical protein